MRAGGNQGLKTRPRTLTIRRGIEGLFRTRLSNQFFRGKAREREWVRERWANRESDMHLLNVANTHTHTNTRTQEKERRDIKQNV